MNARIQRIEGHETFVKSPDVFQIQVGEVDALAFAHEQSVEDAIHEVIGERSG